jgi:hypothetical protein
MDKQILKSLFTSLNPGSQVNITFAPGGANGSRSGDYTVLDVATGRGRGGSKVVTLRGSQGEILTTGTKHSGGIVNITMPDGQLWGYKHPLQMPSRTRKPDPIAAGALKEAFVSLISLTGTPGVLVEVTSNNTLYNGSFEFRGARLNKGRFGPAVLSLYDPKSGVEFTLNSWMDSGTITGVTTKVPV